MQLAVLVSCTIAIAFSASADTRTATEPPVASWSAVAIDPAAPGAEPGWSGLHSRFGTWMCRRDEHASAGRDKVARLCRARLLACSRFESGGRMPGFANRSVVMKTAWAAISIHPEVKPKSDRTVP